MSLLEVLWVGPNGKSGIMYPTVNWDRMLDDNDEWVYTDYNMQADLEA